MQRITPSLKNEVVFLAASGIYLAAILFLFPYLQFYVDNPDSISYITIASKYFHHDYPNAINGYWSPLISWILALIFNIPKDPVFLFKMLQLLIGWFAIFNIGKLVQGLIHSMLIQTVIIFSAIPLVLNYALLNLTADLLFFSVILFYLRIVTEREFYNHRHFGLIAGVLGVILYFSKSFGLVFFLAHFSILTIKISSDTREFAFRRHILKNYLQSILLFITVSSIWIYLLSHKYGHFTISENASFNLSKEVVAGPEERNKLPILDGGLFQPPNSGAVNAWEDPGSVKILHPINPLQNSDDLHTYLNVVKRNWFSIYYFDFRRQPGIIFLILFFIFLFNPNRKKILTEGYCFSLLVSLAIIYFGYSMILVHSRYTWVCTLAMLLLSAWILEEFRFKKRSIQSGFRKVVILLIAVLTIKRPVKELLFTRDSQISWVVFSDALLHPARTLEANYSEDKYFFERKNEIKNFIKPGSSLALTGTTDGNRDSYTRGSLLAMACGAKFLGIEPNDAVIAQQTIQADYLMIFSPVSQVPDSVHWQMEFDDNKMPIRIFARKK